MAVQFTPVVQTTVDTPDYPSGATLHGVSCHDGSCEIVGSSANTTSSPEGLLASVTGNAWTAKTVTGESAPFSLAAAACETQASCTGGGYALDADGAGHALLLDGTTAQASRAPEPVGATQTQILGADCSPDGTFCIQVGNSYDGTDSAFAVDETTGLVPPAALPEAGAPIGLVITGVIAVAFALARRQRRMRGLPGAGSQRGN